MYPINPLIPMGAITGRPTRDEISKILSRYRDAGFEQYLIYPRSGCELEYLSKEYLDTIETICMEAEKLGFKALWLYDEFNWPSGTCGKRIPHENSDFAAQILCAYNVNGKIQVEIKRNNNYTDLMNPDAVDRFIELTHECYFKRLNKWFGTLIKGIFTDEPDITFYNDCPANEKPLFAMGYYTGLEDDYRALTGGNLFDDIAAGVRASENFYPTVCAPLLAKRFRSCFIDRVQNWCTAHNIVLTGHLMDEATTRSARRSNGELLTALSGMKLPGIDDIYCQTEADFFEYLTYSTAMYAIEKQGNNGGLAELFACCKCDIDFARLQQIIFLAGAFGIDHYLLAVAAMDPRGNSIKKEYYNPFSWEVPQLPAFREWSRTARRAAELALKKRRYEAAVRYTNTAPDLNSLLRELSSRQISWKLIANDEPVPDDVQLVLNCDTERLTVYDEKNNFSAFSVSQIITALQEKLELQGIICYPDGALVNDVFVRRYADNSLLVIDMAGRSRELVLHRNNQKTPFVLPRFGVIEFPGWQLDFENKHIERLEFNADGTAEVTLETAQKLQLALRNYAGTSEITVDGRKITPSFPCSGLPESFNALYKIAELGDLPQGKHTFTVKNDIKDFPFLPTAFLLGGENLPSYAGRIVQKAQIHVPDNALKIKTTNSTPPGDMELFINCKSYGIRLTAPYEWLIPDDVRGRTAEIKLSYSSSISALFGNAMRENDVQGVWLRGNFAPDWHGKPPVQEIQFI